MKVRDIVREAFAINGIDTGMSFTLSSTNSRLYKLDSRGRLYEKTISKGSSYDRDELSGWKLSKLESHKLLRADIYLAPKNLSSDKIMISSYYEPTVGSGGSLYTIDYDPSKGLVTCSDDYHHIVSMNVLEFLSKYHEHEGVL